MQTNTEAYVADKLRWAHGELGRILDTLSDVIDVMHNIQEEALLTTLASDYHGLEATRRIIRARRNELGTPRPVLRSTRPIGAWCCADVAAYGLCCMEPGHDGAHSDVYGHRFSSRAIHRAECKCGRCPIRAVEGS